MIENSFFVYIRSTFDFTRQEWELSTRIAASSRLLQKFSASWPIFPPPIIRIRFILYLLENEKLKKSSHILKFLVVIAPNFPNLFNTGNGGVHAVVVPEEPGPLAAAVVPALAKRAINTDVAVAVQVAVNGKNACHAATANRFGKLGKALVFHRYPVKQKRRADFGSLPASVFRSVN